MSDQPLRTRSLSTAYQLCMLVLCAYALLALGVQAAMKLTPETVEILQYADYGVCAIFFGDFFVSLFFAPDRKQYLFRWGWLDLLSSIPMLDAARWGRAARVVRIFRVLRGLRATKVLARVVMRNRAENTFLAASLVALLLVVVCSIAALEFEDTPEANIKTAEDALWWSFATITTVGYGDRYPVTTEGRFVAAILMSAGVGLFGTFSGFLAAWFLAPEEQAHETELIAVREELSEIRSILQKLAPAPESTRPEP